MSGEGRQHKKGNHGGGQKIGLFTKTKNGGPREARLGEKKKKPSQGGDLKLQGKKTGLPSPYKVLVVKKKNGCSTVW